MTAQHHNSSNGRQHHAGDSAHIGPAENGRPHSTLFSNLRGNGNKRYAHIVGWGMAVPERVLSNHDMAAIVETNDEWIRTRTGIAERRIADEKESTAHLAFRAAQRAISIADIVPVDIDLIIVATSTPEHIFPSTASIVQDWLGAGHAGAFDLSAACSGFVYALDMAAAKIRAGDIDIALVVGAETMSRVLDWSDRSTCILFGDGAGAVVVEASTLPGGVTTSILRSDGSGWDMLGVPTVGSRDTYLQEHLDNRLMHRMHMNGRDVFRFATRVMHESIRDAVKLAELEMEEIDLIIPHQANQRIVESAARQLKLPVEKFYSNVSRYGNTSAASIPIALCEAINEGLVDAGDKLVFCGFGGGLTWATMTIKWETSLVRRQQRIVGVRRRLTYWYAIMRNRWIRLWRRIQGRVKGSPMSKSRMKALSQELQDQSAERDKDKEKEPAIPHHQG